MRMSKKKSKEYRDLELNELKNKIHDLKANYAKEIVKSKTGSRNEKAVCMKNLRRNIARALTIVSEKEYSALNKTGVKKIKAEKPVAKKIAQEKKSEPKIVKKVKGA